MRWSDRTGYLKVLCCTALVFGAMVSATPATAQSTLDFPVGENMPYWLDSGGRANMGEDSAIVFEADVTVDDAAWLRLYFDSVELEKGSTIRMTAPFDGEVQELDATGIAMWSYTSAYFNGNTVHIELIAAPGTTQNHVVLDSVAAQIVAGGPRGPCADNDCGICGPDNRAPSDEDWAGRLMPVGCTASIYNTFSCAVSAGHCVQSGLTLQFRVPDSSSGCYPYNPGISDQFPITDYEYVDDGTGNDWSVMTVGTNNQGDTPYERYGVLRPISGVVGFASDTIVNWGFGVDNDNPTRSQTQQTHTGTITSRSSDRYLFNVDITYGNSGSSILLNDQIIGIVTHCSFTCGYNTATRIDLAAFADARATLCPGIVIPENDDCANALAACTDISYAGTTTDATVDGDSTCADSSSSPDVWYHYTPESGGTATIETCGGGDYDGAISVHSGCPGTTANQVACDDDGCGSTGGMATVTISVTAGQTYYIRVMGYQDASGGFTLDITGPDCIIPDTTPPEPVTMSFSSLPTAVSTSAITMTATEAIDAESPPVEYYFWSSEGNPSTWQPGRTYVDSGLTVNTVYIYYIRARDSAPTQNMNLWSIGANGAYTLAYVPAAPTLSNPADSTMDLNVNLNGNPSHTEFAVQCTATNPADGNWTGKWVNAAGNPSSTGVWQIDGDWGTTGVQNLQPSTDYTFAVKARNGDNIETALGPTATETTATGSIPTGACCYANGSCAVTTDADCTGDWQGAGTNCSPNPCSQPGACCYADGSCAETFDADCTGDWQGAGTDCSPNPCPQPTGACCYAGYVCEVSTAGECGGVYLGNDTVCAPVPCTCEQDGDVNGDGSVDGMDIAGFARVKLGTPDDGDVVDCADFDNSGDLNLDIADFVAALLGA